MARFDCGGETGTIPGTERWEGPPDRTRQHKAQEDTEPDPAATPRRPASTIGPLISLSPPPLPAQAHLPTPCLAPRRRPPTRSTRRTQLRWRWDARNPILDANQWPPSPSPITRHAVGGLIALPSPIGAKRRLSLIGQYGSVRHPCSDLACLSQVPPGTRGAPRTATQIPSVLSELSSCSQARQARAQAGLAPRWVLPTRHRLAAPVFPPTHPQDTGGRRRRAWASASLGRRWARVGHGVVPAETAGHTGTALSRWPRILPLAAGTARRILGRSIGRCKRRISGEPGNLPTPGQERPRAAHRPGFT